RPPAHLLELLHPPGHAAEGQAHVGHRRRLTRPIEVGVAERIEGRARDGVDAGVERLQRRELARPERVDQAAGVAQPGRAHAPRVAPMATPFMTSSPFTSAPPLSTARTLAGSDSTAMSTLGSPSTTSRSASLPASIDPRSSARPISAAP